MAHRLDPFGTLCVFVVSLSACDTSPETKATHVLRAWTTADVAELNQHLHPQYRDPRGDIEQLLRDHGELQIAARNCKLEASNLSQGSISTHLRVQGHWQMVCAQQPRWHSEGPLDLELVWAGRWRVRSGLMTDVRDIEQLWRALTGTLSPTGNKSWGKLVHPLAADALVRVEELGGALQTELAKDSFALDPSLFRLEIRTDLAHLDHHFTVTRSSALPKPTTPHPGSSASNPKPRPGIAAFTLRRSAGRWLFDRGLVAYFESVLKLEPGPHSE